jgi:hypothetical protein
MTVQASDGKFVDTGTVIIYVIVSLSTQELSPFMLLVVDIRNVTIYVIELHRWCNGWFARLQCGRSWVRAPIMLNQKDYIIGICCFSAEMQH